MAHDLDSSLLARPSYGPPMRPASLALAFLIVLAPNAEAYHLEGRHWPGGRISVRNASPYPYAVGEAMRLWNASGIQVRFVASRSRGADLVVVSPGHKAARGFGGCAGVASVGYLRGVQARMGLAAGCADDVLTAKAVAHELGHVLGLGHEDRRCALMNPVLDNGAPRRCFAPDAQQGGVWRCRTLEADDLAGARRLYGGRARLRRGATCPIFAAPSAPTAVQATDDGFGSWTVSVTTPPSPRRLVRISGVTAPEPTVLAGGAPLACPTADTQGVARGDFAEWSSTVDLDLEVEPSPGRWCFAGWITDPQGRRSAPTLTQVDVAPPSPVPPVVVTR
jgi:Metallo-peptidase family M12B Reprolysin-like